MSETDVSSLTIALIQVGATIFCTLLVAIQGYQLNRVEQGKLRIERFSGISEKCELDIRPVIEGETNETIMVTNKGTVSIDDTMIKIDLLVERRKEASIPLNLSWSINTMLNPKEVTTIPLHEKLWPFLEQNHLVKLVKQGTIPVEDPDTGEDVDDEIYTANLEKQFSILIDIQVSLTIQKEVSTIRKKYRLHYSWKTEPNAWYEDDYLISTSQYMGEWVN